MKHFGRSKATQGSDVWGYILSNLHLGVTHLLLVVNRDGPVLGVKSNRLGVSGSVPFFPYSWNYNSTVVNILDILFYCRGRLCISYFYISLTICLMDALGISWKMTWWITCYLTLSFTWGCEDKSFFFYFDHNTLL